MLIAAVKRMIPLSIKVKLKTMLLTPASLPPPTPRKERIDVAKPRAKSGAKPIATLRPCVRQWPHAVCECDMHLGAFKRARIHKRLLEVLNREGFEYVEDIDDSEFHIAVDIACVPRLQEVLAASGFNHQAKRCATSINEYDFPPLKDEVSLAEVVPAEYHEIRVKPIFFCRERGRDADAMSILISTFNDAHGVRLFHSTLATVRTHDLAVPGERALAQTASPEAEPIDIVITTVDGSDPAWQEKFNAVMSARAGGAALAKTVNAARFTHHDELRFVLRSIHYYAPYVRKIHIVTDAQCPRWLDTDHPRINLVDHKDIIDPQYLPTFNSDGIESCLWKIPGLSERFVYFNDDMLLTAPTSRHTFYTSNGLSKLYASPRSIPAMPAARAGSYTMHAHLQSADALEKRGYGRPSVKFRHAPYVARKSLLEAMEAEFADELAQTRSSPFRSEASFATISFLYLNYVLAIGQGVLSEERYQYIDVALEDWKERLLRACSRTDVTFACVNEAQDAADDSLDEFLAGILSSRFPSIAPWERSLPCVLAGGCG